MVNQWQQNVYEKALRRIRLEIMPICLTVAAIGVRLLPLHDQAFKESVGCFRFAVDDPAFISGYSA